MAVGIVMRFSGVGSDKYDAVMNELGLPLGDVGGDWPEGLISHAAGSAQDGGWIVVDVWQSQEQFDQFLPIASGPPSRRSAASPSPT